MYNRVSNVMICSNNISRYRGFQQASFTQTLSDWVCASPGEERDVVAARMRDAYEKGLTYLSLYGCRQLTCLPDCLPTSLTTLDLRNCSSLISLPQTLPPGLTDLYLRGCTSLTALPLMLPASLTDLNLSYCSSLMALPERLPSTLAYLYLRNCTRLTALPQALPDSLIYLNLNGCTHLTALPASLPRRLVSLNMGHCTSLKTLSQAWPLWLNDLNLDHCTELLALPAQWPPYLSVLRLNGCISLIELPDRLPATLNHLHLIGCLSLNALPHALPAGLITLEMDSCVRIETLPAMLPPRLTELGLSACSSLTELPRTLPSRLTCLNLNGCTALTTLPDCLPAGLLRLYLYHCLSLNTLPERLPSGLTVLALNDCASLASLPDHLPADLTILDLSDCSGLIALPPLPPRLAILTLAGCTSLMTLPKNIPVHLTIRGFNPVYARWYQRVCKTKEQIDDLVALWPMLHQEHGFNTFESLLLRLEEHELQAMVIPQHVVEVIDEVISSTEVRQWIVEATAEADQDCHDRVLLIFNTIQALARASVLQRNRARESAILALALGMVKQALLDEVVPHVMEKQWLEKRDASQPLGEDNRRRLSNAQGSGPNINEALEVQLALRDQLASTLSLPFPIQGTLYTEIANLNESDRAFAVQYVEAWISDKDKLLNSLLAQRVWTHYLKQRFAHEIAEITENYAQKMEMFEERVEGEGETSECYVSGMNQLSTERDNALQLFLRQKTLEAYHFFAIFEVTSSGETNTTLGLTDTQNE